MTVDLPSLAAICMRSHPAVGDVVEACALLRSGLDAVDAYVVRSGDPYFARLDASPEADPREYEIKQKGYWLLWQGIVSEPGMPPLLADVRDRFVLSMGALVPGTTGTHAAAVLPLNESNSELLVVHGPWPQGVGDDVGPTLRAAQPMFAYLVGRVLQSQRSERQHSRLRSLADVARAFSQGSEADSVLTSVANALAAAARVDWVLISLYDEALANVTDRAMNDSLHSQTEAAAMARDGRVTEMLARSGASFAREALDTGEPRLIPDVFAADAGLSREVLAYYERAHVLSTATFPLIFGLRKLGTVTYSSTLPHEFDEAEVAFLRDLTAQSATSAEGFLLHRELVRSQEELRRQAEALAETSRAEHFLARTDALTGIPNRRHVEEVLEAECARAARYNHPVSVMIADLDDFKRINDTYGHRSGDEALRFVARLARESCRTTDFVARWGGDEFVFVLPETALASASAFAERFRRTVAASIFRTAKMKDDAVMSVSCGIAACGPEAAPSGAPLLDNADSALYEAKRDGGARVVCYTRPKAA